ncbi:hypothetical protein RJI07_05035 [Mycoplasmatota bacterium WC30]
MEKYRVISVVGNSKNAGKTTVINSVLSNLKYNNIAITSIGLDGEEIDQVTFMEKPRIYAKKGYLIATAENTLKAFEAKFDVIQETNIFTSIGNVVIVRITEGGNALVAGPSVILDMQKTIKILNNYTPKTIFIDGAFFRHSLAKIADATVLVIGANLSVDIDKVTQDAVATVRKFSLPKADERLAALVEKQNVCLVNEQFEIEELNFDTVIGNTAKLFIEENKKYRFLYLPKAMTNEFLLKMIEERLDYHFDIIVKSPVNIQLNMDNLGNLFKLKNTVYILEEVNLVAVCYNPVSPKGYAFNDVEFKKKLEDKLDREVFNVSKEVSNE